MKNKSKVNGAGPLCVCVCVYKTRFGGENFELNFGFHEQYFRADYHIPGKNTMKLQNYNKNS